MQVVTCNRCAKQFEAAAARVNRAVKIAAPLYCGKGCAGLARRLSNPPTDAERKAAKAAYDRNYRELVAEKRRTQRADYYATNRARILEGMAEYRKKRMPAHVEYCRRPEYRAYKHRYDRKRKEQEYAEWAEAWRLLLDLEKEIRSQATAYERRVANGYYLRNAQKRRRELWQQRKNLISTPAISSRSFGRR